MKIDTIAAIDASSRTTAVDRQQQSPHTPLHQSAPQDNKKSRFEAVSVNGKEIIYRALDPETGITLAEVPSEEVRRVAERLQQLIAEGKIG